MGILRTCLLVLSTALTLAAEGGAQSSKPGKTFQRYSKPLTSLRIEADGTITRGAKVHNRAPNTIADFTNVDLGGFTGVDTGNGFCEWIDAGKKGFLGNQSDLASTFVFAYCSAMMTPGSGGPGGSVKIGFYEGYAAGGGAPSTVVAVMTFTGLPGNTASSSFFGGFRCYFVEACFPFCVLRAFADGPIGYSWKFLDVGTTGVLAGTWPFLSCVMSCSGTLLWQTDGQGMLDVLDEYCPPGSLRSTFSFGTTSGTFTSISMEIREARDAQALSIPYNSPNFPNRDKLTMTPAHVSDTYQSFTMTVSCDPIRSQPAPFQVIVHPLRHPLPDGSPTPYGRLLVGGQRWQTLSGSHDGTTGSITVYVPPLIEYAGLEFFIQAYVFGDGNVRLSSAIQGLVGTF